MLIVKMPVANPTFAFLEVVSGAHLGTSILMTVGSIRKIGRSSDCDVPLYDDFKLAQEHCAVSFDGEAVHVYALAGANLEQSGVAQPVLKLKPHDRFVIGDSELLCQIPELVTETDLINDAPPSPLNGLRDYLSQLGGTVYVILDAARHPVHELLQSLRCEYRSLFESPAALDSTRIAPYLVALPVGGPALELAIRWAWGRSSALFLTSEFSFQQVRKHLRHFLRVRNEMGTLSLFRFYDPRTTPSFLRACDLKDLSWFFGPSDTFLAEGARPSEVLTCRANWVAALRSDKPEWVESRSFMAGLSHIDAVCDLPNYGLPRAPGFFSIASYRPVLDEVARRNFVVRLPDYARERMPPVTTGMAIAQLPERVADAASRAYSMGVRSDAALVAFVCLTFLPGPPFWQLPELQSYFLEAGPSLDQKLTWLFQNLAAVYPFDRLELAEQETWSA